MKIKECFKEKKNKRLFVKCLVALLFPFVLCLLYCLVRGISLGKIYVPASKNNDSLYYFKLVESIRYNLILPTLICQTFKYNSLSSSSISIIT